MHSNFTKMEQSGVERKEIMNFTGVFNHGLDPKNRVFIPAEFREDLGETFYIYKSPENCICLYNQERWDQLTEKINDETNSAALRMKKRQFFSRVSSCKMDKQGRITIPADFLAHASLTKDAVIAGMGNCVEIWDADEWKKIECCDDSDDLSEGIYF